MKVPIHVFDPRTKREKGKVALMSSISAAKAVADVIRTTLGPMSMLKMLIDSQGGIVVTNDGNAILREIDVSHPAAKSMITLSKTQDENVGDGTTSVVILAGEVLHMSQPILESGFHPTEISTGYRRALEFVMETITDLTFQINIDDKKDMLNIINSCVATKFTHRFGNLMAEIALEAVKCVTVKLDDHSKEIDLKNFVKIEKIPGGAIEDCCVLKGVMFNKDVINPGRMRRKIEKPRILLLDCALEYKKGENVVNVEMQREEDFTTMLKIEEDWIQKTCEHILLFKPDIVITEKGISDLASYYLQKSGISAIRRVRKTDNARIARACGATIVHRPDEIQETDVGCRAGQFEVQKLGDELFSFITHCEHPKACTIVLRGASKDILNEAERNLMDAMAVTRNIFDHPKLFYGGGSLEVELSKRLTEASDFVEGSAQLTYRSLALALEVIPRTLTQNCGANIIRTLTKLRAKHAEPSGYFWGVDGYTGMTANMKELEVWDSFAVKISSIQSAIETASVLLRIDEIVSGIKQQDVHRSNDPKDVGSESVSNY